MPKARVGLVGAGYVCTRHLLALKDLPSVEVVGVCDTDQAKAQTLAQKFGIAAFPSLAAMAAAQPQIIHVLTPPASHCALTLEAIAMGCHVFVEKPMAESAEECDRMIAAARAQGVQLSVNHSDLFDPVVLRAIQLVRSGACGDIIAVHGIRSSDYPPYAGGPLPAPYRQGSYPFRDLGVHGVYVLESFLGPVRNLAVRYYETGRDPMLTFDEWRVYAECERGTGYLYLSWNSRPAQGELSIHGTRAVIHVDRFLQTCEISRPLPGPKQLGILIGAFLNAVRRCFRVPLTLAGFMTGSIKPSPGIYRAVQDFHRALQAGVPPPVSPEDGRRVVAVVAAAAEKPDREKQLQLEAELTRPLEPAQILVTGGAGFVGRALVARLVERKESVRLLLRRRPTAGAPPPVFPALYGSLGQPDVVDRAVEGVDLVYHLGAGMKGGKEEFEQGTVWGTRNIIEACLKHKVKRLVYVSSLSVMDHAGHPDGVPIKEDSPYEPFPHNRGVYTQTKLTAERMVLDAMRDRGLPAVVIRPGQIFGPGGEHVSPNGVIAIAGQWIVGGSGKRALPLVYRDDVVDALLAAGQSPAALGQVVNIVDPVKVDQNEYLRHAKPAFPKFPALKKVNLRRVPVAVLMLGASAIELLGKLLKRDVPLTRYKIRSLKPLFPFDVSRAREILGWTPRVGVKEGLRRTFGG